MQSQGVWQVQVLDQVLGVRKESGASGLKTDISHLFTFLYTTVFTSSLNKERDNIGYFIYSLL